MAGIIESGEAGIFTDSLKHYRRRAERELGLNLLHEEGLDVLRAPSMPASFLKELFILVKTMATDTACIIQSG